jgi:MoxR-like ATPase
MFDPAYHDMEALLARVPEGLVDFRGLNEAAALVQRCVQTGTALRRYALALWETIARPHQHGIAIDGVDTAALVLAGASPRGMSLAMRAARVNAWLAGRGYVEPADVHAVLFETLAHRIFFEPVYELRRAAIVRELFRQAFARVPAP